MTEMWSLLTESPQTFKGGTIWQTTERLTNTDSHRPNISSVISAYKQPSKSAQSIEITGFIEKSEPPKIIFFYTLLPLTAWVDKGKIKGKPRAGNTIIWQTADSDVLSQTE